MLSSVELFLLSGLFLATAPKEPECCKEQFSVPGDEGEWSHVYAALREKNILDKNNNITGYGQFRAHNACSQGTNFKKIANNNTNAALAMLAAAVEGIEKAFEEGYDFSERAVQLFTNSSVTLAELAATETV